MRSVKILLFLIVLYSCNEGTAEMESVPARSDTVKPVTETSLVVLGTIQDAGSPQTGCIKDCCKTLYLHPDKNRQVVSLGLIDPANNKNYLFEATPDLTQQVRTLMNYSSAGKELPDGIFVTHAHIGHYTGLMYLGKEALNTDRIPVYTMPRMRSFLEQNGPWSQLVNNNNIVLQVMKDQQEIKLTANLTVKPFTVPHRDEFSETVGYTISGPNKKALFIPDIDKWQKWDMDIIAAVSRVDYAFVDATFFDAEEINNRDIAAIPHPFIIESMNLFKDLPASEKKKIFFIHFNHTNPVINKDSRQYQQVIKNGFNIARINDVIKL